MLHSSKFTEPNPGTCECYFIWKGKKKEISHGSRSQEIQDQDAASPIPGETPFLTCNLLLCPHMVDRGPFSYKGRALLIRPPCLLSHSTLITFFQALSPNILTMRVRALTYEFAVDTHSVHSWLLTKNQRSIKTSGIICRILCLCP